MLYLSMQSESGGFNATKSYANALQVNERVYFGNGGPQSNLYCPTTLSQIAFVSMLAPRRDASRNDPLSFLSSKNLQS